MLNELIVQDSIVASFIILEEDDKLKSHDENNDNIHNEEDDNKDNKYNGNNESIYKYRIFIEL